QFSSFASDISANGRFVVFESNGDVATQKIPSKRPDGTPNTNPRNNEDGNREIFLADYAQRRVYQITDTKNVTIPTPADPLFIKVEISNNRPMISLEPQLLDGKRVYVIVFSSNAPTPAKFDGT